MAMTLPDAFHGYALFENNEDDPASTRGIWHPVAGVECVHGELAVYADRSIAERAMQELRDRALDTRIRVAVFPVCLIPMWRVL